MSIIKKGLLRYYGRIEHSSGIKKHFLYGSILFYPCLVLALLYVLARVNELYRSNPLFWILVAFSSLWFLRGPKLVHRYYQAFISFQKDEELPESVRDYFIKNKEQHFSCFIKSRLLEGAVFIIVAIVPILLCPEILTRNVTSGYPDPFFWFFILFLAWFVFYCANTAAFITLLCKHVIKDLSKGEIFKYDPRNRNNKYTIKKIKELCGKATRYTGSAVMFIPLALFYLLRQPELVFSDGQLGFRFMESSHSYGIILLWIVGMMVVFSSFLLVSLFYPKRQINLFVKKMSNILLEDEERKFGQLRTMEKEAIPRIAHSTYAISEYLQLQEIRLLCRKDRNVDVDSVLTILAAILSFIAAIPGIVQLIQLCRSLL